MVGPGPWYGYLEGLKVVVFFFLLYCYLPSRVAVFRREDGRLDRVFISLVYMVAVTIVLVHFLAFLRLYDTFSLAAGYIAVGAAAMWLRGRSPAVLLRRLGTRIVVGVLDAAERSATSPGTEMEERQAGRDPASPAQRLSLLKWVASPPGGFLAAAVLVYSAYLRFHHSLAHSYLGAPDSYVHLAWAKYLGANQIYRDGVYPYGYHSVLSALEKLTFAEPLFVARFMGPVGGFLLVLSLYYVSRRLCRGLDILALPGVVVFGLGIGLPSAIWMQVSAFPQVFAAVFFLPGLYFAIRYLDRADKRDLALSVLCLGITAAVYPGVSVYLALGMVLVAIAGFMSRLGSAQVRSVTRLGFELVLWGGVAVAVALLPIGLGRALGVSYSPSLSGAVSAASAAGAGGQSPAGDSFVLLTLALTGLLVLNLARREARAGSTAHAALPLVAVGAYLVLRSGGLGLPLPTGFAPAGVFFSLVACLVYGFAAYNVLTALGPGLLAVSARRYVATGIAVVALLFLGIRYPVSPPAGVQLEYDAAVDNYVRIKASFPALDWTIVSRAEQYPEILNEGWHYRSSDFARNFSMTQAADPSFALPIPTTYVFIFGEKVPLLVASLKDSASDDPYVEPGDRAAMESTIIAWAESYMMTHDDMSVFYEDDQMIVYMIKRALKPGSPDVARAVEG